MEADMSQFGSSLRYLMRYSTWHTAIVTIAINADLGWATAPYTPSISEECTAYIKPRPKESIL